VRDPGSSRPIFFVVKPMTNQTHKTELRICQKVFIAVNPTHMDTIENNPIIDCEIDQIKKTTLTDINGTTETIEYHVESLCFGRWVKANDIFTTYELASNAATKLITTIIEKRHETDLKIKQALAEIDKTEGQS
jgi:hypothetical protein